MEIEEILTKLAEQLPPGRLSERLAEAQSPPLKSACEQLVERLTARFPLRILSAVDDDACVTTFVRVGILVKDDHGLIVAGRTYTLSHLLPLGVAKGQGDDSCVAIEQAIEEAGYTLLAADTPLLSSPAPGYSTYALSDTPAGLVERPASVSDILFYDSSALDR